MCTPPLSCGQFCSTQAYRNASDFTNAFWCVGPIEDFKKVYTFSLHFPFRFPPAHRARHEVSLSELSLFVGHLAGLGYGAAGKSSRVCLAQAGIAEALRSPLPCLTKGKEGSISRNNSHPCLPNISLPIPQVLFRGMTTHCADTAVS